MFVPRTRLKTSHSTDSILKSVNVSDVQRQAIPPIHPRARLLNHQDHLNRSLTVNMTQSNGDSDQNTTINSKRSLKESQIDSPNSFASDTSNDILIIEDLSRPSPSKSQSDTLYMMNQQNSLNNRNSNVGSNEQLFNIEWEKIISVDEQNDKMIEHFKFQVDSLTLKIENISEEDAHLANEIVNKIDGFSKLNLVSN